MNSFTVIGNLTSDPELRFTPSGSAVVNFTIAQTPRKFNSEKGQYEDSGIANYYRATVWNQKAQNVADSLKKGDRVIAIGKLSTEKYTRNNEEVTSTNNLEIEYIGPELTWATATVTRSQNSGNGGNGGGYNQNSGSGRFAKSQQASNSQVETSEPPF